MRINFLAPCKDLSGGLRVIAAHGNALLRRGHEVNVIYPEPKRHWKAQLKLNLRRYFKNEQDHLDKFRGNLIMVPKLSEEFIPKGDALIATAWETAEWAKNFNEDRGEKFYLIQGYETWAANEEAVIQTFKYPFKKMVISTWLKDIVEEKSGENDIPVVWNGKDFHLSESLGDGLKRIYDIGMTYSPNPNKGAEDGLNVLKKLKQKYPQLKFVIFGSEASIHPLPDDTSFFVRPTQDKIREIYLSTRIWINTSRVEGFCLPILEAMSLGCAVVSMDNLGVRDIIDNEENGFIVPVKDTESMINKVQSMLDNSIFEKQMQSRALEKSELFSWARSGKEMEKILIKN